MAAIVDSVTKILAALPPSLESYGGTGAALRAKAMGFDGFEPGVALSESGNPGLISPTPLVSLSVPRYARI